DAEEIVLDAGAAVESARVVVVAVARRASADDAGAGVIHRAGVAVVTRRPRRGRLVGRAGLVHAVAALGAVALAGRLAADDGIRGDPVRSAGRAIARARLGHIAHVRCRAAHLARRGEVVVRAVPARAGASLGDVTHARRLAAHRGRRG